jgi:hypothetical protein
MYGKNHQQTVIVKYKISGRREAHVIELLPYHVNGYARTRCLTHGREQVDFLRSETAEGLDRTARGAAVSCGRAMQLPYGWKLKHELAPLLHLADGEWTRIEQSQEA